MHHLLMILAAAVVIALTATGIVGGPLDALLLVGLLLLCPLLMLGMHRGARTRIDHATDELAQREPPREEVGCRGR